MPRPQATPGRSCLWHWGKRRGSCGSGDGTHGRSDRCRRSFVWPILSSGNWHQWRRGDIVVWDNRCTMHKANADYPEGERREMHRFITEGTVPV